MSGRILEGAFGAVLVALPITSWPSVKPLGSLLYHPSCSVYTRREGCDNVGAAWYQYAACGRRQKGKEAAVAFLVACVGRTLRAPVICMTICASSGVANCIRDALKSV